MSDWVTAPAYAKVNLALLVGPLREDAKHEVVTVMERVSLADQVAVRRARVTQVEGFAGDTLVRAALEAMGRAAGGARFEARLDKQIPVSSGLGGGSSDAATALRLANALLETPLAEDRLHALAARLGADVPFFLRDGPQLATGDGTTLEPVSVPRDHVVLLALPDGVRKRATADVYRAFDARDGADGFAERAAALRRAIARVETLADLSGLPPNDLARSPLSTLLRELGARRADVTGAGPIVFGLFDDRERAEAAALALPSATTWVAEPVASVSERTPE